MLKSFVLAATGATPVSIGAVSHGTTVAIFATMLVAGLIYGLLRKSQASYA